MVILILRLGKMLQQRAYRVRERTWLRATLFAVTRSHGLSDPSTSRARARSRQSSRNTIAVTSSASLRARIVRSA